jgi:gas vesicle protein
MHVNEDNSMKYALSFLLGTAMGAAVALLFAPSSGEELRTNIKTQADTQ